MICNLFEQPQFLFFIADAPPLLYYSHIPAIIISLLIGVLVFFSNPTNLQNRLFALISVFFSAWAIINLALWTNVHSEILIFLWSLLGIIQGLIAILSVYFVYVFLSQKDVSTGKKFAFFILLLPLLVLSSTDINLSGFNLTECHAFGYEGIPFYSYYTLLGILSFLWIGLLLARAYKSASPEFKKQILLLGSGIELFLISFFFLVFFASYLTELGLTESSDLEMYSLFGMIFFMILITVQIVRFKTFNINLAATNALVIGLVILIGSLLFIEKSTLPRIITSITLVLTLITSYYLIISVKKEVRQREELENLTKKLAAANLRLKELDKAKSEFVSIASHQLRSPLTAIRGYASMILEGSYGTVPEKALESLKRIEESAKLMSMSIEDYLNVSRIESGNMKYNLSDFNLQEMASHICDDLRPEAMKRNLILLFRSNLESKGIVTADLGKTNQIIHNLINNSIKYTEKGSISVFVKDDVLKKRISIAITDTGIGMSQETMAKLFHKFSRAENANSVNTSGTGLGLYVALKMAEAMGGSITCTSEGNGKGSTFTFELPLVM